MNRFYAHQCPETERWFVCLEGADDNLCEVFSVGGIPASNWAEIVANVLTAAGDVVEDYLKRQREAGHEQAEAGSTAQEAK